MFFSLNWRASLVIWGSLFGSLFLACFLNWVTASATYRGWEGFAGAVDGNVGCRLSSGFPVEVRQWCEQITYYAEQQGFSPDLVASVIWLESGGQAQAYSHSGAVGLMQVMPRDGLAANFTCTNGPCFGDRPTIKELKNPEFNLAYGTKLLAGLAERHGNMRDALRSYGPKDVGYSYADKVLGIYDRVRGH